VPRFSDMGGDPGLSGYGPLSDSVVYSLGAYRLDTVRRLLIGEGEVKVLPENLFQILLLLLQANGRVVDRDTFFSRIWPAQEVTEGNLTQHVFLLRSALKQKSDTPPYVVSVSGRGYRLGVPSVAIPKKLDVSAPQVVAALGELFVQGSFDAYRLYCVGSHFLERRTHDSLRAAVDAYSQAVDIAPGYALAHLGLARAHAFLGEYFFIPPAGAFPPARASMARALELDPTANAHALAAEICMFGSWDWEGARAAIDRAFEIDPHSLFVRYTMAWIALASGDMDRALAEIREALVIDPVSLVPLTVFARILTHRGDIEEAVVLLKSILAIDPTLHIAREWYAYACNVAGMPDAAIELLKGSSDAPARALLARAYAEAGNLRAASRIYDDLLERSRSGYVPGLHLAIAAVGLGLADDAIAHLTRSLNERESSLVFLKSIPLFAPIERRAAFQGILKRVGP
jgi:DNA-binding winged helix-turn-helix (wHTH) protein/cytochrome c-type biogenesis protein CcmH/NrfG